MSKMNLFKTKDKRVLEEKDKDYLKLIEDFKKYEEYEKDLQKKDKDLVLI